MEDTDLTWAHPEVLWALTINLLIVILRQIAVIRSGRLLNHLVASRLKEQLLRSMHPWLRATKFWLTILGLTGVILAIARPQWGAEEGAVTRRGLDVMVVMDTSRSMLAEDIPPNRLERAKFAVQDLMALLEGDRLGLVGFAGDAFLQCPLTTDYGAFMSILDEVDTELLPTGGTNIAKAIGVALKGFGSSESDNRAILLITDGEELNDDAVAMAREAADQEVRVFAIGFGTPAGAKIPITEDGQTTYVTDETGQEVVTKLDEKRLREIASVTNGMYLLFEGSATVRKLMAEGLSTMTRQDIDTRDSRRPIERFQWPLGFGIGLLILSTLVPENRRMKRKKRQTAIPAVIAGIMAIVSIADVRGEDGRTLFAEERYKEAVQAYEEERESNGRYEDRIDYGAGTAAYKAGDYEVASRYLGRALTSDDASLRAKAAYNLGNTFYRIGEQESDIEKKKQNWLSAISQYEAAEASKSPVRDQARHNRELIEQKLKELEQEQSQEDQEKEDEEQEKEDEKKDEQDKQEGEDEEKDQQDKDQQDQEQGDKDEQNEGQQDQEQEDKNQQDEGQQDQEEGEKDESESQEGNEQEGQQDPKDQGEDQQGEGQENPQEEGVESGDKPQPASPTDEPGDQPDEQEQESSQSPQQPEPSEDLDGDVKPQGSEEQQSGDPSEPSENQPSAYELTPDGKMSEAAARALLESLEGEELKPPIMRRSQRARVLRDW